MSLEKEIKQKINSPRHEALLNIVHTANAIDKVARKFFGAFGLTEAQYNIMVIIRIEGRSLTQVEISERMVSSRANITSLLDKLETKGYIKRVDVEGDRRVYAIELTMDGKKILEVVEVRYVKEVEKVMGKITEDESRKLSALLVAVRGAFYALGEEDHGEKR